MAAQRFDLGLSEQQTHSSEGTQRVPVLTLDEVCVLPAGHPLLERRVLQAADFEDQDFISLSAEDPYRLQLDALFAAAGVHRRLRVETHSAVAVCAMVQQGLGLAIVNPLTALALAGPGLQLRRFSMSVPFQVSALLPLYRPAQPLAQSFLQALLAQAERMSSSLEQAIR